MARASGGARPDGAVAMRRGDLGLLMEAPRPDALATRGGIGKPQRQKTYTLRGDKDLRACRSDFDPRPLGNGDGPVLAARAG